MTCHSWQKLVKDEIRPGYLQLFPDRVRYATNITRATTLVCDPHIQFMPKLAQAIGDLVNVTSAPTNYSASVGNVDPIFMSYMVYNYAVQQAIDVLGIFRYDIRVGAATGNATLIPDPANPTGGTVPKPPGEVANAMVNFSTRAILCHERKGSLRHTSQNAYIGSASKAWLTADSAPQVLSVNGQLIRQSLTITAALPQVLVAGALYFLLGLAALFVTFRVPGAPFTLAGLLMMHSKLQALRLFPERDGLNNLADEELSAIEQETIFRTA